MLSLSVLLLVGSFIFISSPEWNFSFGYTLLAIFFGFVATGSSMISYSVG
jgi:hypothetical protein